VYANVVCADVVCADVTRAGLLAIDQARDPSPVDV
jgi:hypothetical protein